MTMSIDELLKASGMAHGKTAEAKGGGEGFRRLYLHAGQLYASAERMEIVTILGSCVAVCMYDAARGVGGLNHFMLPMDSPTVSSRYANHAFDMLLKQLIALGAARARLEAKIFGGASLLKEGDATPTENDLGARNIAAARMRLAQENIPLVAEDVGGRQGRKLVFETATGIAQVRQV